MIETPTHSKRREERKIHQKCVTLIVLTLLTLAGCRAEINEPALIASLTKTDADFGQFLQQFPEAETSANDIVVPMSGFTRFCHIRALATLANGDQLGIQRQMEIDRKANLVENGTHFSPTLIIKSGDVGKVILSQKEFEKLMMTDDVTATLNQLGIDFRLKNIEQSILLQRLRESSPEIAAITSRNGQRENSISLKPFRKQGELSVFEKIDTDYMFHGVWQFELTASNDDFGIVRVFDPKFELVRELVQENASELHAEGLWEEVILNWNEVQALLNANNKTESANSLLQQKNRSK